jgi:hypothetical protein
LPPVNQETDSILWKHFFRAYHTNAISRSAVLSRKLNKNRNHKMRSGLVPSLNIINMETNRVSQLDETGGYIFLNNMPLLLPLSADSKGKRDWVCQASGL